MSRRDQNMRERSALNDIETFLRRVRCLNEDGVSGRRIAKLLGVSNSWLFELLNTPEPNSGCWLWIGAHHQGYGTIWDGKRQARATHISLLLHGRPIPEGMHACHRCDNPCCVNPDHIFIGTRSDNMRDMHNKGRARRTLSMKGSENPKARLTEDAVRKIRADYLRGVPLQEIRREHGLASNHAWSIIRGKLWRHVVHQVKA